MNMEKNRGLITRIWNWVTNFGTRHGYPVRVQITSGFVDADHAFLGRCMAGVLVHVSYRKSVLFFIRILYCLFESYVHHCRDDMLVNLPTNMVASSVERC